MLTPPHPGTWPPETRLCAERKGPGPAAGKVAVPQPHCWYETRQHFRHQRRPTQAAARTWSSRVGRRDCRGCFQKDSLRHCPSV